MTDSYEYYEYGDTDINKIPSWALKILHNWLVMNENGLVSHTILARDEFSTIKAVGMLYEIKMIRSAIESALDQKGDKE